MGCSSNGKTIASKPINVGSIPTLPADKKENCMIIKSKCYKDGDIIVSTRFALFPIFLEEEDGYNKYIWFQFYKTEQIYHESRWDVGNYWTTLRNFT